MSGYRNLLGVLAAVLLVGCGGGGGSSDASTPVPVVSTPVPVVSAEKSFSTCQADSYLAVGSGLGGYMLSNNVWNPTGVVSYTQCVDSTINERDGVKIATFNWNFVTDVFDVHSFPELLYGQRLGTSGSSTTVLPRRIDQTSAVKVKGNVVTSCGVVDGCKYGTGFDLWFQATNVPTQFTPKAELMVILDTNWMNTSILSDVPVGVVEMGGIKFNVIIRTATNNGVKWEYIAYVAQVSVQAIDLDLMQFIADAKARGVLVGSDYVSTVELGTEVVKGQGSTSITNYSVTIQ